MPVADLLTQLANAADAFLRSHPPKASSPGIYTEEIKALRALAGEVKDRRVKLTLEESYEGLYEIINPLQEVQQK